MSRASARVKAEIVQSEIAPILLVRILNMPRTDNPASKESLYLTDCDFDAVTKSHTDINWFNENGTAEKYYSRGVKFEQVQVSTDNTIETSTISLGNVDRTFSALAQFYKLNGVEVHVFRGFRDLLAYPDGAQLLFVGHIKKAVITESAINAEVWADFSLKKKCPRRFYCINDFPYIPAAKDVRRVYRG